MKIAVVGAGATASYVALRLVRSGVDTTLIARRRDRHFAAVQKQGVTVLADEKELTANPLCTDDPAEAGSQDFVIATERESWGPETAEATLPLLGPGTSVVTARTGVPWWYFYRAGGDFEGRRLESVDPGRALWNAIGPDRAIGCAVGIAAKIVTPGTVHHLSGKRLALGEPSGEKTKRVEALSGILADAGFEAPIVDAIRDEIWEGLFRQVALGPVGVLTCASPAKIAGAPGTRAVATAMTAEANCVGEALGIRRRAGPEKQLDRAVSEIGRGTPMLGDLTVGQDMSIDALGTAVQEMARMADVGTPTMDAVLALARLRVEVARPDEPHASAGPLAKSLVPAIGGLHAAAGTDATTVADEIGAAKSALNAAKGILDAAPGLLAMRLHAAAGKAAAVADEIGAAVKWAYDNAASIGRRTAKGASNAAAAILATGQALLATRLADDLNRMLASLAKGAPTVYDKAMDAKYIATGIGGGLHRLFDGGHTLWGAYKAARDVPGDDGVVRRVLGMTLGLFRDATTPAGLPFATWDKATYHKVADSLKANFGLPKKWFEDLVTYDGADVVSALLGGAQLVFCWSKEEARDFEGKARNFARIVANTSLAAFVKRNPLLAVVSLAALAKTVLEARKTGNYEDCAKGFAEGAVTTAAPMAVVPLITMAGGPASVALGAGIISGMAVTKLAKKAGDKKALDDLATRVSGLLRAAASAVKNRFDK